MKLILLFLMLSINAWSTEIRLTFEKSPIQAGELVYAKVENYNGPTIKEKLADGSIYFLSLGNQEAEVVFLKNPTSNSVSLEDGVIVVWNPVEITETQAPENFILSEQVFKLSNNLWILYFVIALLIIAGILWGYFVKLKPKLQIRKERKKIKENLFKAEDFLTVSVIWKEKHLYIETFPFIEEEFNKFEVVFYKYAFKPSISNEDKKEILKSYSLFLDHVRGGPFGV